MFVVPRGVSSRIGEILEVIWNTRVALADERRPLTLSAVKRARVRAEKDVAERHGMKAKTVLDKFRRQLNLSTGTKQFDIQLLAWLKDHDSELQENLQSSVGRRPGSRDFDAISYRDFDAISGFFDDARRVDQLAAVGDEGNDHRTLDDIVPDGADIRSRLQRLSNAIEAHPPRNFEQLVEQTIRRDPDTPLVRALKEACGYRCQFPECSAVIPMRTGGYYVEVAHIKPVCSGGRSVLGNLLVLCPNHHKEFDLGAPNIEQASVERVSGELNGRRFEIRLPGLER